LITTTETTLRMMQLVTLVGQCARLVTILRELIQKSQRQQQFTFRRY